MSATTTTTTKATTTNRKDGNNNKEGPNFRHETINHNNTKNNSNNDDENNNNNNNNNNNSSIIPIPERSYGYRSTPMTWTELQSIVLVEQNLAKLSRSVTQEQEYQLYLRDLRQQWNSVYDHILVTKFGFQQVYRNVTTTTATTTTNTTTTTTLQQDGSAISKKWHAHPPLAQVRQVQKVLKRNDFPYYTDDGIEHWVLWKLVEPVTDDEIEQAKQELRDMLGDVVDVMHWVNPPHLKSLPEIDHAHILCLRRRRRIQQQQ